MEFPNGSLMLFTELPEELGKYEILSDMDTKSAAHARDGKLERNG